jgi:hypothetical protein
MTRHRGDWRIRPMMGVQWVMDEELTATRDNIEAAVHRHTLGDDDFVDTLTAAIVKRNKGTPDIGWLH